MVVYRFIDTVNIGIPMLFPIHDDDENDESDDENDENDENDDENDEKS